MKFDQMRRARAEALASGWRPDRARAKQEAGGTAKVYLDDVIDSWGGVFGISAREFRQTLAEITADEIELHINSPGGDAFEGVAMLNALKQHDARVTVMVDGLAASAASLVAMAGDEIVMGLGTQLMIHDAWALAIGNAEAMQDAADRLSKLSDGYADVYAQRTGRPVEEMRALMRAEAWLNADEAIEQGFATRKVERDGSEDNAKAKALLIAAKFGIEHDDALKVSRNVAAMNEAFEAGVPVDLSAYYPLTSPAEPADGTTPTPTQEVTVADDAATTQVEPGSDSESPPTTITPAASAVGPDLIAEVRKQSEEIASLKATLAARDKAEFFDTVTAQGRLAPADRAEYEALYDAAPDQTKALLLAKAVGSAVPVVPIGHEGDAATDMAEYEALYGKGN